MSQYWVYENWTHEFARVHIDTCSYCNAGHGIHSGSSSRNGVWHGPFASADDALAEARRTGRRDVRPCAQCATVGHATEAQSAKGYALPAPIVAAQDKSDRIVLTYVVSYPGSGLVKIGQAKYYADRMMQLRNGSPIEPSPVCAFRGAAHEKDLHARFAHLRKRLEYFSDTPELRKHIDERQDRISHEDALKISPLLSRAARKKTSLEDADGGDLI